MNQVHTVYDTETGGFAPDKHALVEVAYGVLDETNQVGKINDVLAIWPEPGKIVEPSAAEVNGFTTDGWFERNAMTLTDARFKLGQAFTTIASLGPIVMWAHNAPFDKRFTEFYLPEVASRVSEWRCTQKWMRALFKARGMDTKGKGTLALKSLCKLADYHQVDAHGAFEDVFSTSACLRYLMASGVPYPTDDKAAA